MTGLFPEQAATGAAALRRAATALRVAGIDDAELEAEALLRHALGRDRAYLYLHLPDTLTPDQQRAFAELLRQRLARRPAAYITGHRAFYDIDLHVAPGVLIPRPETELLVDESLRLLRERDGGERLRFVDVGTGSGAVALAVAKHAPAAEVLAVDSSRAALAIAGFNAKRLRLAGRVRFLEGDLLSPVPGPVDVVAANLPYIPTSVCETLQPEVRDHEPRLALDGGSDGLDCIRRLLAQLGGRVRPGGACTLEIGWDQAEAVRAAARELAGADATILPDVAGHDRIAVLAL
jgi:release factor glutamine methyltransferase